MAMKKDIRLIAFDLDDTLLNTDKTLSEENRLALCRASAAGIYIVPATGRIFCGLSDCVRALPLDYTISANGAEVTDIKTGGRLYNAFLSNERALELMHFLDPLPVAYDCYLDSKAYMARYFYDRLDTFIVTPPYLKLVRGMRNIVPYLPDFVKEKGLPVQKAHLFAADPKLKAEMKELLEREFPDLCITSSAPENLEINVKKANKGDALLALCEHLHLSPEQTMAFGDGLNDVSMLKAAGIGVAMANAGEDVKAAADHVTLSNNEAGVAAAINLFCFPEAD